MAGGADAGTAGAVVPCPRCGTAVLQKAMIPVGVLDGVISYLCIACARTELRTGAPAGS